MKSDHNEADNHNAQRRAYARELGEPHERPNPIPRVFLVFAVCIVIWGVSYFYFRLGGITGAGDTRSPVVAETSGSGGAADGAAIYAANCQSCHQASGQGLPGAFPPLDGSGWVTADAEVPVQILLHGINGKITVAGTDYQSVMPSFAGSLSDAEIAAVVTHIRQTWSNDAEAVETDYVAEQRALHADRSTPWNGGAEIREVVGSPE